MRALGGCGCGGACGCGGPQGFKAQHHTVSQQNRANMRQQALGALMRYGRGMRGLGDSSAGFPAGSQATFAIQSTQTTTQDASSVVANVAGQLSGMGINVVSVSIKTNPSLVSQAINMIAPLLQPFTVMMTVIANNDYAQASDLLAIVNHAFYVATGQMPTASQVASQNIPGTPPPPVT